MSDSDSDNEAQVVLPAKKDKKQKRAREEPAPVADMSAKWDLNRYINKQRTLVFSSRGINHRDRHLLSDLRDMLPHSKKDFKFDAKGKLSMINEVCELKSCNNCIFLESKKRTDLYMWISKAPHGPSARFLLQNIHTMSETKLTGNCLKGSRPLLVFDKKFDSEPHLQLMKEMFTQVFGSPKGHPRVKPFVDHVLSFLIVDGRIWFRNYQATHSGVAEGPGKKGKGDLMLVEIGPRFVLNPIKVFGGSFGGVTLWDNPSFVSPNALRSELKKRKSERYTDRLEAEDKRKTHESLNQMPEDELAGVFGNDEDDEGDEYEGDEGDEGEEDEDAE